MKTIATIIVVRPLARPAAPDWPHWLHRGECGRVTSEPVSVEVRTWVKPVTLTPTARREAELQGLALEQHPERAFVRTSDGYTPAPGYVFTHTPGVGWYHRHESEPERTIRFYDPLARLAATADVP